jgi:hypothetical protein
MREVQYLIGSSNFETKPDIPYNAKVCNFLADLSVELNSSKNKFSDIKTLAFWCRKKNILKLKEKFDSSKLRLGLGLLFHITPSNIPTNFAYSLIFGLLTGNSNIVKIPTQNFDQVNIICNVIKKLIAKKKYSDLKKRITVVRYKDNDEYTKKISSLCNARIIWGGDKTVSDVRKIDLNQRALDISFADRYSLSIINLKKLNKISPTKLNFLTEKFYNDTYSVDQNACSSPHLILWYGKINKKLQNQFWVSLSKILKDKKYSLPETAAIEKYNQLCGNILDEPKLKNCKIYDSSLYTLTLNKLDSNNHNLRGKWGYFFQFNIKNLNELLKIINNRYQTLSYFGLKKSDLEKFISDNRVEGIDRIVPIGQALDINFFWDGYDINNILTRVIDIK